MEKEIIITNVERKMLNDFKPFVPKPQKFIPMFNGKIFEVGAPAISNDDVHTILGGSKQMGMRRCIEKGTLTLISNTYIIKDSLRYAKKNRYYYDRWKGDTFEYTGMGLRGDQSLDFMQNKTLCKSNEREDDNKSSDFMQNKTPCKSKDNANNNTEVEVHVFEVLTPGNYTYRGWFYLADKPFPEIQKDMNGQERKAWVFPLRRVKQDFPELDK